MYEALAVKQCSSLTSLELKVDLCGAYWQDSWPIILVITNFIGLLPNVAPLTFVSLKVEGWTWLYPSEPQSEDYALYTESMQCLDEVLCRLPRLTKVAISRGAMPFFWGPNAAYKARRIDEAFQTFLQGLPKIRAKENVVFVSYAED